MAEGVAHEVADDFVDKTTIGGKLWWLLVAVMRIGLAAIVIITFVTLLITVKTRYQADATLNAANGGGAAVTATQLFGELAAASPVAVPGIEPVQSPLANRDLVEEVRVAAKRNAAVAQVELTQSNQAGQVDALGQAVVQVAKRACAASGAGWDPAMEPLVAAAKAAECIGGVTDAKAAALLRADLQTAQTAYENAHVELLRIAAEREKRVAEVNAQRFTTAGELAVNYGAISAHDQLMTVVPTTQVRGFLTGLFSAPLLLSTALLVFIAGMLGAVVIQLVLIAFPDYLPLTLGSGKYFFLRVPMGGIVALLVLLALQSGVAITGLTDLSAAAGDISVGDPAKLAFVGLLAGAFAEKIGQLVVGYVNNLGGGSAYTPPPAEPAYAEPDTGLMSPGAAEEAGQRFRS